MVNKVDRRKEKRKLLKITCNNNQNENAGKKETRENKNTGGYTFVKARKKVSTDEKCPVVAVATDDFAAAAAKSDSKQYRVTLDYVFQPKDGETSHEYHFIESLFKALNSGNDNQVVVTKELKTSLQCLVSHLTNSLWRYSATEAQSNKRLLLPRIPRPRQKDNVLSRVEKISLRCEDSDVNRANRISSSENKKDSVLPVEQVLANHVHQGEFDRVLTTTTPSNTANTIKKCTEKDCKVDICEVSCDSKTEKPQGETVFKFGNNLVNLNVNISSSTSPMPQLPINLNIRLLENVITPPTQVALTLVPQTDGTFRVVGQNNPRNTSPNPLHSINIKLPRPDARFHEEANTSHTPSGFNEQKNCQNPVLLFPRVILASPQLFESLEKDKVVKNDEMEAEINVDRIKNMPKISSPNALHAKACFATVCPEAKTGRLSLSKTEGWQSMCNPMLHPETFAKATTQDDHLDGTNASKCYSALFKCGSQGFRNIPEPKQAPQETQFVEINGTEKEVNQTCSGRSAANLIAYFRQLEPTGEKSKFLLPKSHQCLSPSRTQWTTKMTHEVAKQQQCFHGNELGSACEYPGRTQMQTVLVHEQSNSSSGLPRNRAHCLVAGSRASNYDDTMELKKVYSPFGVKRTSPWAVPSTPSAQQWSLCSLNHHATPSRIRQSDKARESGSLTSCKPSSPLEVLEKGTMTRTEMTQQGIHVTGTSDCLKTQYPASESSSCTSLGHFSREGTSPKEVSGFSPSSDDLSTPPIISYPQLSLQTAEDREITGKFVIDCGYNQDPCTKTRDTNNKVCSCKQGAFIKQTTPEYGVDEYKGSNLELTGSPYSSLGQVISASDLVDPRECSCNQIPSSCTNQADSYIDDPHDLESHDVRMRPTLFSDAKDSSSQSPPILTGINCPPALLGEISPYSLSHSSCSESDSPIQTPASANYGKDVDFNSYDHNYGYGTNETVLHSRPPHLLSHYTCMKSYQVTRKQSENAPELENSGSSSTELGNEVNIFVTAATDQVGEMTQPFSLIPRQRQGATSEVGQDTVEFSRSFAASNSIKIGNCKISIAGCVYDVDGDINEIQVNILNNEITEISDKPGQGDSHGTNLPEPISVESIYTYSEKIEVSASNSAAEGTEIVPEQSSDRVHTPNAEEFKKDEKLHLQLKIRVSEGGGNVVFYKPQNETLESPTLRSKMIHHERSNIRGGQGATILMNEDNKGACFDYVGRVEQLTTISAHNNPDENMNMTEQYTGYTDLSCSKNMQPIRAELVANSNSPTSSKIDRFERSSMQQQSLLNEMLEETAEDLVIDTINAVIEMFFECLLFGKIPLKQSDSPTNHKISPPVVDRSCKLITTSGGGTTNTLECGAEQGIGSTAFHLPMDLDYFAKSKQELRPLRLHSPMLSQAFSSNRRTIESFHNEKCKAIVLTINGKPTNIVIDKSNVSTLNLDIREEGVNGPVQVHLTTSISDHDGEPPLSEVCNRPAVHSSVIQEVRKIETVTDGSSSSASTNIQSIYEKELACAGNFDDEDIQVMVTQMSLNQQVAEIQGSGETINTQEEVMKCKPRYQSLVQKNRNSNPHKTEGILREAGSATNLLKLPNCEQKLSKSRISWTGNTKETRFGIETDMGTDFHVPGSNEPEKSDRRVNYNALQGGGGEAELLKYDEKLSNQISTVCSCASLVDGLQTACRCKMRIQNTVTGDPNEEFSVGMIESNFSRPQGDVLTGPPKFVPRRNTEKSNTTAIATSASITDFSQRTSIRCLNKESLDSLQCIWEQNTDEKSDGHRLSKPSSTITRPPHQPPDVAVKLSKPKVVTKSRLQPIHRGGGRYSQGCLGPCEHTSSESDCCQCCPNCHLSKNDNYCHVQPSSKEGNEDEPTQNSYHLQQATDLPLHQCIGVSRIDSRGLAKCDGKTCVDEACISENSRSMDSNAQFLKKNICDSEEDTPSYPLPTPVTFNCEQEFVQGPMSINVSISLAGQAKVLMDAESSDNASKSETSETSERSTLQVPAETEVKSNLQGQNNVCRPNLSDIRLIRTPCKQAPSPTPDVPVRILKPISSPRAVSEAEEFVTARTAQSEDYRNTADTFHMRQLFAKTAQVAKDGSQMIPEPAGFGSEGRLSVGREICVSIQSPRASKDLSVPMELGHRSFSAVNLIPDSTTTSVEEACVGGHLFEKTPSPDARILDECTTPDSKMQLIYRGPNDRHHRILKNFTVMRKP